MDLYLPLIDGYSGRSSYAGNESLISNANLFGVLREQVVLCYV